MVNVGTFSAWIQVDKDTVLPEYSATYSADGSEATCWVPSEAGKVEQHPLIMRNLSRLYSLGL